MKTLELDGNGARGVRESGGTKGGMPRQTGLFVGLLALFAGLAVFLYLGLRPSGLSDNEEILGILDDFRAGVARQNADLIFSHLDPQFQVEGLNRPQARLELMQFFRQHSSTAVVFRSPQLSIKDSQATLDLDADVTGTPMNGGASSSLYHGEVQVELVKEPVQRFMIFPDHQWKIKKAHVPNLSGMEGV